MLLENFEFEMNLVIRVILDRLSQTGDDFSSFSEFFWHVKAEEEVSSDGKMDSLRKYYFKNTDSPEYSQKAFIRLDEDCLICYEKPVSVALFNCHHMVTCKFCVKKISFCPICREYIVHWREFECVSDTNGNIIS